MSKYPFGRLAVGQSESIPATMPRQTVHVAMSKFRDTARREFGLGKDELPAFRITEDTAAGTYVIERLPDGSVRGQKAQHGVADNGIKYVTEYVADPQPIKGLDILKRE